MEINSEQTNLNQTEPVELKAAGVSPMGKEAQNLAYGTYGVPADNGATTTAPISGNPVAVVPDAVALNGAPQETKNNYLGLQFTRTPEQAQSIIDSMGQFVERDAEFWESRAQDMRDPWRHVSSKAQTVMANSLAIGNLAEMSPSTIDGMSRDGAMSIAEWQAFNSPLKALENIEVIKSLGAAWDLYGEDNEAMKLAAIRNALYLKYYHTLKDAQLGIEFLKTPIAKSMSPEDYAAAQRIVIRQDPKLLDLMERSFFTRAYAITELKASDFAEQVKSGEMSPYVYNEYKRLIDLIESEQYGFSNFLSEMSAGFYYNMSDARNISNAGELDTPLTRFENDMRSRINDARVTADGVLGRMAVDSLEQGLNFGGTRALEAWADPSTIRDNVDNLVMAMAASGKSWPEVVQENQAALDNYRTVVALTNGVGLLLGFEGGVVGNVVREQITRGVRDVVQNQAGDAVQQATKIGLAGHVGAMGADLAAQSAVGSLAGGAQGLTSYDILNRYGLTQADDSALGAFVDGWTANFATNLGASMVFAAPDVAHSGYVAYKELRDSSSLAMKDAAVQDIQAMSTTDTAPQATAEAVTKVYQSMGYTNTKRFFRPKDLKDVLTAHPEVELTEAQAKLFEDLDDKESKGDFVSIENAEFATIFKDSPLFEELTNKSRDNRGANSKEEQDFLNENPELSKLGVDDVMTYAQNSVQEREAALLAGRETLSDRIKKHVESRIMNLGLKGVQARHIDRVIDNYTGLVIANAEDAGIPIDRIEDYVKSITPKFEMLDNILNVSSEKAYRKEQGVYDKESNTIKLSQQADVSTVYHELLHAIVELQMDTAEKFGDQAKQAAQFRRALLDEYMGVNENRNWSEFTPEERYQMQERFVNSYMMHSIGGLYRPDDYIASNTLDAQGHKTGRIMQPLVAARRVLARYIGKHYDIHPTKGTKTDEQRQENIAKIVAASKEDFAKNYGLSLDTGKNAQLAFDVLNAQFASYVDSHRLMNAMPIGNVPMSIRDIPGFTEEQYKAWEDTQMANRAGTSAAVLSQNDAIGQMLNKNVTEYNKLVQETIENDPAKKEHEAQLKAAQDRYTQLEDQVKFAERDQKNLEDNIKAVEIQLSEVTQKAKSKPTTQGTYDKLGRNERKIERYREEQRSVRSSFEVEIDHLEKQIEEQINKERQHASDVDQRIERLTKDVADLEANRDYHTELGDTLTKEANEELGGIRQEISDLRTKLDRERSNLSRLQKNLRGKKNSHARGTINKRNQAEELERRVNDMMERLESLQLELEQKRFEHSERINYQRKQARKWQEQAEIARAEMVERQAEQAALRAIVGDSSAVAALRAGIQAARDGIAAAEDQIRAFDAQLREKKETRAQLKATDAEIDSARNQKAAIENQLALMKQALDGAKNQTKISKLRLKDAKKKVTEAEKLVRKDKAHTLEMIAKARKQTAEDGDLYAQCIEDVEKDFYNTRTGKEHLDALQWLDTLTGENASDALTMEAMRKYGVNNEQQLFEVLNRLADAEQLKETMANQYFYERKQGSQVIELASDVAYRAGGNMLEMLKGMIEGKLIKGQNVSNAKLAKMARIRVADLRYSNASPSQIMTRYNAELNAAFRELRSIKRAAEAPDAFARAYDHVLAAQILLEQSHLVPRLRRQADSDLNSLAKFVRSASSREHYTAESILAVQLILNKVGKTQNSGAQMQLEAMRVADPDAYERVHDILTNSSDFSFYRNLTFSEIFKVADLCNSIMERGRIQFAERKAAEELETQRQKEAMIKSSQDVIESSDKLKARQKKYEQQVVDADKDNNTLAAKTARLCRRLGLFTKTMQSVTEIADGKRDGPINKYFFANISNANARYLVENRKLATKIKNTVLPKLEAVTSKQAEADLPKSIEIIDNNGAKKVIDTEGTGSIRKAIMPLLLHLGTDSNTEALARSLNLTPDGLIAEVHKWEKMGIVTPEVMDVVQAFWDAYAESGSLAVKAYNKIKNKFFELVPARTIEIAGKKYRGGYAPLKRDRGLEDIDLADVVNAHADNLPPTTDPGFAQSRTESAYKLDLSFTGMLTGLDSQLRFAIMMPEINRLIHVASDEQNVLMRNLEIIMPGFRRDMCEPWIKAVANQQSSDFRTAEGMGFVGRVAATLSASVMALNVVNTAQQITGLLPAKTRVSVGAFTLASVSPITSAQIKELSPFMRTRLETSGVTISQLNRDMNTRNKIKRILDVANDNAYILQSAVQKRMDKFIWKAAYIDATQRLHLDGEDAVLHADQAVRMSQGSFNVSDSAAIDRNPYVKVLLPFMNYFVTMANLQAAEMSTRTTYNKDKIRWAMQYIYLSAMITILPSLLSSLISQGLKGQWNGDVSEEDSNSMLLEAGVISPLKSWASQVNPAFGLVVSEVVNAASGGRMNNSLFNSPAATSVSGVIKGTTNLWDAIANGEDLRRSDVRNLSLLASFVLNSSTNISTRAFVIEEMLSGDLDTGGALDATRAVLTGYESPVQRGER